MFIHIDCNTFFASCEISTNPSLVGKPVVVANCNEAGGGIILALSKEAKVLGLKRGDPLFKVKQTIEENNVVVCPANHAKYSAISRKLMKRVERLGLVIDIKQYSIDEFFGELPFDDSQKLHSVTEGIKKDIEQNIGIPVSCGLSHTYTLAKIATWYAKKYSGYEGICILQMENIRKALQNFPIADVWGIGRRTAPKLIKKSIFTALDFYKSNEYEVTRILNINGVRTWKELHGIVSISLEKPALQKSILHSHTFAYMTTDINRLHSYISEYAVAAALKLRQQHCVCLCVSAFLSTNRFREDLMQYQNMATTYLETATADSRIITKVANKIIDSIYKQGFQYKRAGVILTNITSDKVIQLNFFDYQANELNKSKHLMETFDQLTQKYGSRIVKLGSQEMENENTTQKKQPR